MSEQGLSSDYFVNRTKPYTVSASNLDAINKWEAMILRVVVIIFLDVGWIRQIIFCLKNTYSEYSSKSLNL